MSGWYRVPDRKPERWQCDNEMGMMLAIVERGRAGWTWRNTWAGPGTPARTRDEAMQAAERGAYDAPDEEHPFSDPADD